MICHKIFLPGRDNMRCLKPKRDFKWNSKTTASVNIVKSISAVYKNQSESECFWFERTQFWALINAKEQK